jgi:hypothetical protein
MFASNAGCAAIAELVYGIAMIGMPSPIASITRPSARVSARPAAHLLMVLTVAGATMIAEGGGSTSGSPGFLYRVRTGCPVRAARPGTSMNFSPSGVQMTHTFQPRPWARSTSRPTSRAGGEPQTIAYRT